MCLYLKFGADNQLFMYILGDVVIKWLTPPDKG